MAKQETSDTPRSPDEELEGGQTPQAEPATDTSDADKPVDVRSAEDPFNDAVTDQAVDDIVRTESDALLDAEDTIKSSKPVQPVHRGFWYALGRPFAFWWRHHVLRWLTILLILGGIGAAGFVPTARYWVLNRASVTVAASARVLDSGSGQPLKDISVSIDGVKAASNAKGIARFDRLALGPHTLTVSKSGFAPMTKHIVLGLGSNPLGDFQMRAVGVQYTFQVADYISGQAVEGAEVSSDTSVAISDKQGKAVLTLSGSETGAIALSVARDGYRTEKTSVKAFTTVTSPVRMVTTQRTVFVTKANGKYDVVSSDIDGQNKKVLMAGTGTENSNIALVVSPDGSRVAVVSTRDNQRDSDGYLLSTLSLITVEDGTVATVAHAEQMQIVDFIGTRLVYEQVNVNDKTQANNRYSIVSFDYTNGTRLQLAAGAHFNTVFGAQGSVYYAVANNPDDASVKVGLYRVNADNTNRLTIFDKEVWSSYRLGYNVLGLQGDGGLYQYDIKSGATTQIQTFATQISRGYVDQPTNKQSIWIDSTGAKGVLYRSDRTTAKDTVVGTQAGLTYPLRWLNDSAIIFRVVTGSEVADYVVSATGDKPAYKIADVTNTFGVSQSQ